MVLFTERISHTRLIATRWLVVLLFQATGNSLFAQETVVEQETTAGDTQQTGEVTDQSTQNALDDVLAESVRSMFQEKESPLLHIRWGTRVYLDAPLGNEPAGAGLTLRKAELKLSRQLGKNFRIKLSGTYNKGEFNAGDSYLVYSGWKSTILTTGVHSPPYSLESTSASSAISFMEPALSVAALSENRNAGVDFLKRTPNHVFSGGWAFYNPRQDGVSEIGQALVGRYVYSPINFHGHENLHLGGSFSYRFLDSSAKVQFRSRPEVATANEFYVDTDSIYDSRSVMRAGLEVSQVNGRFSWQSEILASRVTRKSTDKLGFWGAYIHFSQFLTSDSRNYDQGSGTFVNVKPNSPVGANGWGAFELAFRVSYIDLTDKEITGGRQSNISLGLNWYLNEKFRVMANAIKVLDVDRPGSEYDDLDPLIFALRGQWLIY